MYLFSLIGVSAAEAANLYWRGNFISGSSRAFEDPINWSTTLGGSSDTPTVPGSTNTAVLYLSHTGSTMTIRSHASVQGLVINRLFTGSILLGTGSLNFGSNGVRMGSGRLIGSGHLLGGSSNISGSGSFTMTGGVVRLAATNLLLSGSLVISKGLTSSYTEFVSTGTLVFNSRIADQNFTVGSTVNNTYFKNLTLNNTAGGADDDVIVSGTPLKLSGALLITRGNLDLDANNVALRVESGITLAANAQATLTSDQNITASGHIVAGAGAAFLLSSSTANTFTLNGIDQNFDTNNSPLYNLTIASSSGTTLTSDQSVTGTLQVDAGSVLDLNGYTLYATGATIINNGTIRENGGHIEHNASSVLIADASYAEDNSIASGDTMYLTVSDSDANLSGTAQDTFTVTVAGGSDAETVTLTETTNTSGIFRGSIPARASTSAANITVTAGDSVFESNADVTVTLTYTDAQDGETTTDTAALTADVPSTSTTGSSGRTGGGGGRSPSRSTASYSTPVVAPKTVAPRVVTKPTTPALTLKERAEVRKQARLAMLKRALDRAAKRKAARGL